MRRNGREKARGDVVEVELLVPPTATTNAEGRIIRRLGEKGALDVEIERLVTQAGVSRVFPPAVLSDAGRLGDVPGAKNRNIPRSIRGQFVKQSGDTTTDHVQIFLQIIADQLGLAGRHQKPPMLNGLGL